MWSSVTVPNLPQDSAQTNHVILLSHQHAFAEKVCYLQQHVLNVCWEFCTELFLKCDLAPLLYCQLSLSVSFAQSVNLLYLVSAQLGTVTLSCMKYFSISFRSGENTTPLLCLPVYSPDCLCYVCHITCFVYGLYWHSVSEKFGCSGNQFQLDNMHTVSERQEYLYHM